MVRHTHQDFLLSGKGRETPLPLPISMDGPKQDTIRDYDVTKDLFDFGPNGYIRKIPLSTLDRDMDSVDDWHAFTAQVNDVDKILLVDDRVPSDNPIVKDFDTFTKQRYLAALAAKGIRAAIVNSSP